MSRSEERIQCYSKAMIKGTPGYVRDITLNGIKITTLTPIIFNEDAEECQINFYPEEEYNITPLAILGEYRWERKEKELFLYGFELKSFIKEEFEDQYKKLIELYS